MNKINVDHKRFIEVLIISNTFEEEIISITTLFIQGHAVA
jgi:hypothetical protein